MEDDIVFAVVEPHHNDAKKSQIIELLAAEGLGYDSDIELFVVALQGQQIVACLGLAGRILKCAAVRNDLQGHDLARRLVEEMNYVALERGRSHLFLFTKPCYAPIFSSCGFHQLAEVPNMVVLLENSPVAISRYAKSLQASRRDGEKVAGIVLNANPFTLGHAHLVATAASECDVLHVFVVGEDTSLFSYQDRLALVTAGVATLQHADRIVVHPGSDYIVSRATFPSYFLKDAADLAKAATGIDLQLFRRYIAPALGIRHRYVGTEPLSAITNLYNEEMCYWLMRAPLAEPAIDVHIVPRLCQDDAVISATHVRELLMSGRIAEIEPLVPAPTYELIKQKYVPAAMAEQR
ncbi:MAG: [citrate (pro-3S)-lyase] ligase [Propionibacteriaceae bacterium]